MTNTAACLIFNQTVLAKPLASEKDEISARNFTITDFYLWCGDPTTTPEAINHTIAAMQDVVGIPGSDKCFEAQQALRALTAIDLSHRDIDDLRPLSDFPQLKGLDLRENRILDLAPLLWIKSLESLTLEFNPVRNLTPIAKLDKLQTLNVSNTPLFTGEVPRTEENCPTAPDVSEVVRNLCGPGQ
jgi:Leucine-rich repeat (LRR) protein